MDPIVRAIGLLVGSFFVGYIANSYSVESLACDKE